MNSTDWHRIKEEVYYSDGSWRDIYICNTTQDEWSKWIDLINRKYLVTFYNGQTQKSETAIDKRVVFDFWDGKTDLLNSASINIGDIIIKCHFFSEEEIENDIDPNDISTLEDHKLILSYLIDVSNTLNKKVLLTAENQKKIVYIETEAESIKIKFNSPYR